MGLSINLLHLQSYGIVYYIYSTIIITILKITTLYKKTG
jgi:hypothetical protein